MERIIFHIDVNSAFLSWEAVHRMRELGETRDLRDIPSAVGGDQSERHGIILAKSPAAKKYGVKTAEPIVYALKKCPELVIVPASHKLYEKCSRSFFEILWEYSPLVEKLSIDEAYVDMTGSIPVGTDPKETAHAIKDRIREELGFTVNVGISDAKILAKMASDFEKPDKVHTLYRSEIKQKMWKLPVGDLFLVGAATAKKLNMLGIRTIGDLAQCELKVLQAHFGKGAQCMHDYANGIDKSPVMPQVRDSKCCGNSVTMNHDVIDASEAKGVLLSLCESVGSRLRADGVKAKVAAVTIKNNHLISSSHQTTMDNATDVTMVLYRYACALFDELWKGEPIRLLGVSTSHLVKEDVHQYSIFDTGDYEKQEKLEKTVDSLREKYGKNVITRASLMNIIE